MTELRVRPEAEVDAFEAATWYEREREGLALHFYGAWDGCSLGSRMGRYNFLCHDDIRRVLLGRFPFGVFFFVEKGSATVIAVMHLHRHPNSWESRR